MGLEFLLLVPLLAAPPADERTSAISDQSVPLIDPAEFPQRPRPLLEWGNPLLGSGNIRPGIELPTGAVWQPQLVVYGSFHSALSVVDEVAGRREQWGNRLELLANLQLTGTERLLAGVRPLDRNGRFSGYQFAGSEEGSIDAFNHEVTTFFFEGELGELFPNLDPDDSGSWDLGFSIGRQPISFQEGMLISDDLDAIGLIRNTLLREEGADFQVTGLYAGSDIHRSDGLEARDADLYGLFAAWDLPERTVRADFAYVSDVRGDSAHVGIESIERIGHYNASFRVLGSRALDRESVIIRDGAVAMTEISWTPPWTEDLVYVNGFVAVDEYTPAAIQPGVAGPLGRVGILFEAAPLGAFAAPLDNRPDDSVGVALGLQKFRPGVRAQWVLEAGFHRSSGRDDTDAGLAVRYQQAFGRRHVLRLDGYGAYSSFTGDRYGTRVEWSIQF